MTKNSKSKIILAGVLLLVTGLAGFGLLRARKTTQESGPQKSRKPPEIVNQIPIENRPFSSIIPRGDGREVRILINALEGTQQVEYELEYQAGTLLQGAFGVIDFTKEEPPVQRNILLGSCSAGGKCSYHENVNGGTLLLRYQNSETIALKGEWNFQLMRNERGRFSSKDAKFIFDVGESGLASGTFVVVANPMGLPAPVDAQILGGPYQVSLPDGVSLRTQEIALSLRLNEANSSARLFGWSQEGWQEFEAEVQGKTIESLVDQATTFVAVALGADQ